MLVCNDEYWLPYALEASRGYFSRYVIYDVGSTDRTREVIKWFYETSPPEISFFVREMPMVHPRVQGAFRNSMIAEAGTEYYFILDGDELYTPQGYEAIISGAEELARDPSKLYGIVRRVEVDGDLHSAYGLNGRTPHHRLYRYKGIWTGSHPGEVPYYKQEPRNELWIEGPVCYHFHNCDRSSADGDVPKRLERRARPTYRPGEKEPFNLLETLPLLQCPIAEFAPNPVLATMQ